MLNELNNAICISENNRTLGAAKDSAFLTFNLESKATCPYSTEFCRKVYYYIKHVKCVVHGSIIGKDK